MVGRVVFAHEVEKTPFTTIDFQTINVWDRKEIEKLPTDLFPVLDPQNPQIGKYYSDRNADR